MSKRLGAQLPERKDVLCRGLERGSRWHRCGYAFRWNCQRQIPGASSCHHASHLPSGRKDSGLQGQVLSFAGRSLFLPQSNQEHLAWHSDAVWHRRPCIWRSELQRWNPTSWAQSSSQWCQDEQWPNMTFSKNVFMIFIYFLQSSIHWGRVYLFLCSEDSHWCGLRSCCIILVERHSVERH